MHRWIKLTDEYVNILKDNTCRKIRLPNKDELWAHWDKKEGCFWWEQGEAAAYVDEPDMRPTHILAG